MFSVECEGNKIHATYISHIHRGEIETETRRM